MLTQDRDEELVLFFELRHRKKEFDHNNSSSTTKMSSQGYTYRRTAADNFLYSENEKSDYDWLVTPPGSPSKSQMNQLDASDTNPMDLISLLGSCLEEESENISSKSQTIGLKRPSSSYSSRTTSRPSTPTKRSTVPTSRAALTSSSTSRPSTPTKRPSSSSGTSRATSIASRATLTSCSTNSSRSTSRASTPTKRPSSSSGNSTGMRVTEATRSSRSMSRPSTPTNRPPSSSGTTRANLTASRVTSSTTSSRPTSRPSTPTSRPSSSGTSRVNLTAARATTGSTTSTRSNTRPMTAPSPKPGSRSNTPTRRPSTPTGSSTALKSKTTKTGSSIPAPSPILRSRPWEPYDMPGFNLEAPSNLRTTLPDRPQTASSRGTRASGGSSVSSSRSTSIEPVVGRRQSCSPSRNRAPVRNTKGDGSPLLRGRPAKTSNEDGGLSPVAIGNQKVERVMSTRKLAPPRLTETRGRGGSGGSSAGFGRNLSQSSIDMALRHLGVKRGSMTGNLRPQATKVPSGSMYSLRSSSGTSNNRPVSSSGSSESSINILCLDDDNLSDISYS